MRKRDLSPRSDQVFVVIVCVRDVVFEAVVFLRIEGHTFIIISYTNLQISTRGILLFNLLFFISFLQPAEGRGVRLAVI